MKRLDRIKNCKDTTYIEQALSWIEQIRAVIGVGKDNIIYTLDGWNKWNYFLYDNKIIVADIIYPEGIKEKTSIYSITLLCDALQSKKDVKLEILKEGTEKYSLDEFFLWLSEPCQITEMVDVTYSDVISFLRNYKIDTFKTDRYCFYVKRDKDYSQSFNIYAKDLKLNIDLKIYVEMGLPLTTVFPEKTKDIIIDDLSGKLSKYQINQCRNDFMTFIQQECTELKVNNFFALELVKQSIQPVEQDWGLFVSIIFSKKETGIAEIFIDDFPVFDGKPYFILADSYQNITKIAVIDFLKPEYKTTGIYKNRHNKYNFWQLDKTEIEMLINFLAAPYRDDKNNKIYTNWQYLIHRYNNNTGEIHGEVLQADVQMPDYSKLGTGY